MPCALLVGWGLPRSPRECLVACDHARRQMPEESDDQPFGSHKKEIATAMLGGRLFWLCFSPLPRLLVNSPRTSHVLAITGNQIQRQALVPERPIMLPPAHGSTGHEKYCGFCGCDVSRSGHPRNGGGGVQKRRSASSRTILPFPKNSACPFASALARWRTLRAGSAHADPGSRP